MQNSDGSRMCSRGWGERDIIEINETIIDFEKNRGSRRVLERGLISYWEGVQVSNFLTSKFITGRWGMRGSRLTEMGKGT